MIPRIKVTTASSRARLESLKNPPKGLNTYHKQNLETPVRYSDPPCVHSMVFFDRLLPSPNERAVGGHGGCQGQEQGGSHAVPL